MPRTVAEKMLIRAGMRAHLSQVPKDAHAAMNLPELKEGQEPGGPYDYVHTFCIRKSELEREFRRLRGRVAPGGALWVSWPKGKQLGSDLTLHEVVVIGYAHGMVESTCLSINSVWSGLRFTHPKPGRHYRNSHAQLNTEEWPQ